MLHQSFQSLKLYGKEPESLEATITMFQLVLADYRFEYIEKAFVFYLKNNSEMPAPADIATIIERGNKPPFERSVYISATRKQPEERTADEWAYIREYERFNHTGKY